MVKYCLLHLSFFLPSPPPPPSLSLSLSSQGRRYKGFRGLHAAATKIQATYRMSIRRHQYLEHRRQKWAAGIVSLSWIMYAKVYKIRHQLKLARARQLENHKARALTLRRRWAEIGTSKRTIIHIPSLGE